VRLRPRLSRPRLLPTTKRCAPVRRFTRTAVRLVIGIPAMEKPISSPASWAAPWSNRGIRRRSFVYSCRVLVRFPLPAGRPRPRCRHSIGGSIRTGGCRSHLHREQLGTSGTIGEMRRRYRSARSQVSVRHWRRLRDNFAIAKRSSMTALGPRTAAGAAPVPELLLAARCIVYPPLPQRALQCRGFLPPSFNRRSVGYPRSRSGASAGCR
jgi:hypothetical protein